MGGIVVKLDGVTLTAPAWLVKPWDDLQLNSAADGTGAVGSLLIDDADGTQRIRGWQKVEIDEPLCVAANNGLLDAPRLFTGYMGRRTYSRGPYKSGPGRYILCELYDVNVLLSIRMATGGDAKRPEESDDDRLAWLIGSDYLDGLVQDLGLVNGTGLVFEATDTHGQYPAQILQDLTSTYDQLFFAYYDQVAAAVGLFFDFPNALTNTSALSISNDLADIDDDTVWAPHLDGQLDADPADVYSKVRYVYSGGVFYGSRQATADEFFTDNDLLYRGTQVELSKIGKASTAETFANRFLEAAAHERLALSCTVRLPATHVNLLDSGMRTQVKLTHLPDYGFDEFAYLRIQNREVTQVDALKRLDDELMPLYDVKLTLALTGLATIGSGGGGFGNPGSTPPGPHGPPEGAYHETFPVIGDETWVPNSPYGLLSGLQTCALGTTVLVPGDTYDYDITVVWLHGAYARILRLEEDNLTGLPFTVPLAFTSTNMPDAIDGTFHFTGSFTVDAGAPAGANWRMRGQTAQDPHGHTVMGYVTFSIGPTGTLGDEGPSPLQWLYGEVVTMSGANGTTAFAYQPGSLTVYVDGVKITPSSYVETDPTTGDFTLSWAPDADEVVTVDYQGHT